MLHRSHPLRGAFASIVVVLAGCSLGAPESERTATRAPAGEVSVTSTVAHRDARVSAPSFVWLHAGKAAKGATARSVATALLPSVARAFDVKPEALSSLVLDRIDEHGVGPVVLRYRQEAGGIRVFRGGLSVLMSRELEPVAATGLVSRALVGSERAFVLDEGAALDVALRAASVEARPLPGPTVVGRYQHFQVPGLSAPARVERVYFPTQGARLEPGFYVEVLTRRGPSRSYVVSAESGRILFENDLVRADAYTYRVFADAQSKVPYDGPHGTAFSPHPTGRPDRTKLTYVPSELITLESYPFSRNDPWLPPGATTTTGNNVDAYADLVAPDGPGAGDTRSELTAPGVFGDAYDTGASPGSKPESIRASVTQLFYVSNFLHDWFYDAGFDEASGNPQLSNLGRGGLEGDPLVTEAQDNSGRNNANAAVPADGVSPRIQMFVFSGSSSAQLVVNAPATVAGVKSVGLANAFGLDAFDLTGDVVLASDGLGDAADACQPIENDVAGKVVLVHRGTCAFSQKAAAVQAAGGVGCIVANVSGSSDAATPPFMGGTAPGISIPVLSLALGDGQALEGALATGVNVTMKRTLGVDLDGSLDTSIVVHEWGHVLSGRLVADGNGLTTNQAGGLGEGWADFVALLHAARADDPSAFGGAYPNGSYATSGSGDDIYFGTRRVPYSVDFTKNPLTFKHIANGTPITGTSAAISFGEDGGFNAEVHNTGEVWATMLWECYVALLRDGRLTFDEAQTRMKRYLVASLELTPADPTLLEARDAVLAAALATDPKDFTLFFEAFARRGAGSGAEGPPKDSSTNQGVVESFEAGRSASVAGAVVSDGVVTCDRDGILDPGETGQITLVVKNTGAGPLSAAKLGVSAVTPGVTLEGAASMPLEALLPFATQEVKMPIRVRGGTPGSVVELGLVVSDPELPGGQSKPTTVSVRVSADEVEASSNVDRVDTAGTSWRTDGQGSFGIKRWSRVEDGQSKYWYIPNEPLPSDQRLTSAAFTVESGELTLSFRHKYAFRRSTRRLVDLDGGVVEVSLDDGKTWDDASDYGPIAYPTVLDAARQDNELRGRAAFGNVSPGYPDAWVDERVTLALPPSPQVRIRFRAASGRGFAGAAGWSIDDIALEGASTTPFWGFLDHADLCDPAGPTTAVSGPSRVREGTVVRLAGSASHPTNLPLAYEWTQLEGPAVTLDGQGALGASFTAPDVFAPTPVTFELRANDGALLSPAARVTVTVEPTNYAAGGAGCSTTGNDRDPWSFAVVGLAMLAALGGLGRGRGRRGRA